MDAWVGLAEIIGTTAVVISVVYLAIQMRLNTKALQATYRDTTAKHTTESLLQIASDGELASIFRRGQIDPTSLDDDEAFRLDCLLYAIFEIWETTFSNWRKGALSDQDWEKWETVMAFYLSQRGAQSFWDRFRGNFGSEFRQFLDTVQPADHSVWRDRPPAS